MATQAMQAIGPTDKQRQPLPPWPSPTLTNPDMLLPNELPQFRALPSPPRHARRDRDRPPSPSYLKDRTDNSQRARSGSAASSITPRKEKRGLMSRKMMLLRSRTASNGFPAKPAEGAPKDQDSTYASSPTFMDASNVAPGPSLSRWSSTEESPTDSDEMPALPQFLAEYESNNVSGTDDELESSPVVARYGYPASNFTSTLEEERRQKEEDEQNSAILSKRAEQILANAKKRLNLMEGNLRGARDLVAPLTAANLKRATSVASYVPSTAINSIGNGRIRDGYRHDALGQPYRTLQAQASSPFMGRDYQGHWRGFSETEIPERPYTALDGNGSPIIAQGYIPTKANDPLWTKTLKGSRSHDSLGILAQRRPGSRDAFYGKDSPNLNLEPLVEDDGPMYPAHARRTSSQADSRDGVSSYRSGSTPEDLQEQMSSLKGRISALKERAREDSLRRQSMQNVRDPSPLNNATDNAPEFFYASSPTYGSPALDTNTGLGIVSRPGNPDRQESYETVWESDQIITGSRNAFAEQAYRNLHQEHEDQSYTGHTDTPKQYSGSPPTHKRTPSGTAVVQSSKHRYSHHQLYHVQDMQGTYGSDEPVSKDDSIEIGTAHDGSSRYGDDEASQADASVYEEAQEEPQPTVLAHEDREDAFDYEQFFLHSAMAVYGDGERRYSTSSEESLDSVSTARGPAIAAENFEDDDVFHGQSENYPPGTPQTPEKLREIEKNLHTRTLSNESVSTMATFATATEGRETPNVWSPTLSPWPMSPSNDKARPITAIPVEPPQLARSDSSSERADSGVSMNGSKDASKQPEASSGNRKASLSNSTTTNTTLSPPVSPRPTAPQDPATVAVNALVAPNLRQLGLRDKALLFGLVESLKKVAQGLQENDETSYDSRMLRRRLDDARRVLAGSGEVRPGTS